MRTLKATIPLSPTWTWQDDYKDRLVVEAAYDPILPPPPMSTIAYTVQRTRSLKPTLPLLVGEYKQAA